MSDNPENYSPDEIRRRIEELLRKVEEFRFMPVLNEEGEIVSYADLYDY